MSSRLRRAARGQRGDTLLELVVAVLLMGITVVVIVGGLTTAVMMSDIHRKQATAGVAVRDYAEAVQNSVAGGNYTACAGTTTYATPAGFAAPTGYTATVVGGSVRYWNGTTWQATCGTDTGLQRLALRVSSDDGRASEQVVIVIRRRCGLADTLCS